MICGNDSRSGAWHLPSSPLKNACISPIVSVGSCSMHLRGYLTHIGAAKLLASNTYHWKLSSVLANPLRRFLPNYGIFISHSFIYYVVVLLCEALLINLFACCCYVVFQKQEKRNLKLKVVSLSCSFCLF